MFLFWFSLALCKWYKWNSFPSNFINLFFSCTSQTEFSSTATMKEVMTVRWRDKNINASAFAQVLCFTIISTRWVKKFLYLEAEELEGWKLNLPCVYAIAQFYSFNDCCWFGVIGATGRLQRWYAHIQFNFILVWGLWFFCWATCL